MNTRLCIYEDLLLINDTIEYGLNYISENTSLPTITEIDIENGAISIIMNNLDKFTALDNLIMYNPDELKTNKVYDFNKYNTNLTRLVIRRSSKDNSMTSICEKFPNVKVLFTDIHHINHITSFKKLEILQIGHHETNHNVMYDSNIYKSDVKQIIIRNKNTLLTRNFPRFERFKKLNSLRLNDVDLRLILITTQGILNGAESSLCVRLEKINDRLPGFHIDTTNDDMTTMYKIAVYYSNYLCHLESTILVDIVIAMNALQLPAYVLLWIIEYVPLYRVDSYGWKMSRLTHYEKINIITNVIQSIRSLRLSVL